MYKIITRHKGLVQWLQDKGITGEIIEHAIANDIVGCDVVGVLPLHLACLANTVTSVDIPYLPPEKRGRI